MKQLKQGEQLTGDGSRHPGGRDQEEALPTGGEQQEVEVGGRQWCVTELLRVAAGYTHPHTYRRRTAPW